MSAVWLQQSRVLIELSWLRAVSVQRRLPYAIAIRRGGCDCHTRRSCLRSAEQISRAVFAAGPFSRHRPAGSGHEIHLYQPQSVIQGVMQAVSANSVRNEIRRSRSTLSNLFPGRQLIFGIFLFKVLPLPDSREIASEKKDREHDEKDHDAFPEVV
jgi:hypothetical protein